MRLTTPYLVQELRQKLARDAALQARAASEAQELAQTGASPAEKKQDSRVMIEFSNLAHARGKRAEQTLQAISALDAFASQARPKFGRTSPVGLGAIVDIAGEDETGPMSRTLVVLPTGAGEELAGPGGDGIITVITPQSPLGKAMTGKRPGDFAEVTVRGEPLEWEILEVSS